MAVEALETSLAHRRAANPVSAALQDVGWGRFQARMLLLTSCGYFATCSELLLQVFLSGPLIEHYTLGEGVWVWLPVCTSFVGLFASQFAGMVADKYGRSMVFMVSLALQGVAGLLCAWAPSFEVFVALRCLVSIGNSGLGAVDYVVYQEFSPPETGSRLGSTYIVFVAGCLGVLYLAVIEAFWNPGWQTLVVMAVLPVLPCAVMRLFLRVETPHYLVAAGRPADAYAVLKTIGIENGTRDKLMSQQDFLSQAREYGNSTALGRPTSVLAYKTWTVTLPLAAVWLFQSASYWGLTLFLSGFLTGAGVPAKWTLCLMVAAELPGCLFTALLVQHPSVGDVRTLRLNCVLASAACFALGLLSEPKWFLSLLACVVYFSLVPNWAVLFISSPRRFPTELRGTAMGFLTTISSIPPCVVPFVSSWLSKQGSAYMLVWGGLQLCALLASFCLHTLPGSDEASILERAGSHGECDTPRRG